MHYLTRNIFTRQIWKLIAEAVKRRYFKPDAPTDIIKGLIMDIEKSCMNLTMCSYYTKIYLVALLLQILKHFRTLQKKKKKENKERSC